MRPPYLATDTNVPGNFVLFDSDYAYSAPVYLSGLTAIPNNKIGTNMGKILAWADMGFCPLVVYQIVAIASSTKISTIETLWFGRYNLVNNRIISTRTGLTVDLTGAVADNRSYGITYTVFRIPIDGTS